MSQFPYEDIVGLPHHRSATRPHLSPHERAAQFSPFAALTGYGAAVEETARTTEERTELTEEAKRMIEDRLQLLNDRLDEMPTVRVLYFLPDERKAGGAYRTKEGIIRAIEEQERRLIFTDGTAIPIDDLYAVTGALFSGLDPI